MNNGWTICAVAAVGLTGCVSMAEDEDELMLRVSLEGHAIESVEVVARGELGELDDDMRPQPNGLTGIIFTDTTSGETLADGWTTMPTPMAAETEEMPEAELYVVVPAPERGAILTLTLPTEAGPVVMTSSFDGDDLWAR